MFILAAATATSQEELMKDDSTYRFDVFSLCVKRIIVVGGYLYSTICDTPENLKQSKQNHNSHF